MERILNNKDASIKRIHTNSKKEAKNRIQNEINFLAMIYQQSRDPYFGVPKWSEECLKENKTGEISKRIMLCQGSARLHNMLTKPYYLPLLSKIKIMYWKLKFPGHQTMGIFPKIFVFNHFLF